MLELVLDSENIFELLLLVPKRTRGWSVLGRAWMILVSVLTSCNSAMSAGVFEKLIWF